MGQYLQSVTICQQWGWDTEIEDICSLGSSNWGKWLKKVFTLNGSMHIINICTQFHLLLYKQPFQILVLNNNNVYVKPHGIVYIVNDMPTRVAQDEEILEKFTSLGGSIFHLGYT